MKIESQEGKPNCLIVEARCFSDERGCLSYVEGLKDLPFAVNRLFWIYEVPEGATRGGHAHWSCAEAIFPLSGGFDIYVDDGFFHHTYTFNTPNQGIVIPAGVWCTLQHFSPGTVCVVAASLPYDASGYVNDYDAYIKQVRCR